MSCSSLAINSFIYSPTILHTSKAKECFHIISDIYIITNGKRKRKRERKKEKNKSILIILSWRKKTSIYRATLFIEIEKKNLCFDDERGRESKGGLMQTFWVEVEIMIVTIVIMIASYFINIQLESYA